MVAEPALIAKLDSLGFLENTKPSDWYLPFLHFSGDTTTEFFNRFREFATAVKNDDAFISELIRDNNWRATVVGTALAIVLRKNDRQSDMIDKIATNNWGAPQLAVGIALLDRGNGEARLSHFLRSATEESNPKSILSIYAALSFLGSSAASDFENTLLFEILTVKDSWDKSLEIANRLWEAWRSVEPIQI